MKSWNYGQHLIPLSGRLAECPLHHVVRVRGHRAVAPQPAHHVGHDRAAELLPVKIHTPRVVDVVTLLCESLHQPHVLEEPVSLLVINTVANATIIVPPVAQKHSNRLLLGRQYAFGIYMSAPKVHETAHVAQYLPELVGTLPGDRESRDRARTRAAD